MSRNKELHTSNLTAEKDVRFNYIFDLHHDRFILKNRRLIQSALKKNQPKKYLSHLEYFHFYLRSYYLLTKNNLLSCLDNLLNWFFLNFLMFCLSR